MTHGAGAAERGIALLDLGRPADAEKKFREALAADPGNADLLVHLAWSLQQQERHLEARDAAERGLAAAPDHLDGLRVLSSALAGTKDFGAALEVVRRGLQIAPGLSLLHRQEGAVLLAMERAEEALQSLERARNLDPESSDTAALTAAALYTARRFPEAEQAVTETLRLDPSNPEGHRIRGLLSLRRGGGRSAVDAHRSALRLDPTDEGYRAGLATAMKSRNPLYGLLLRLEDWVDGLPSGARWLVLLAPLIATRLLRPFEEDLWAKIVLTLVIAIVIMLWTLEPLMNAVLLASRYGRNLLPGDAKVATYGFLAYLAAASVSTAAGLAADSEPLLVLAIGLALWSVAAGQAHTLDGRRRRVAVWLHRAGALLAAAALVAVALDGSTALTLGAVLVLAGIGMIWFTAWL